jgi:hypothetical protein
VSRAPLKTRGAKGVMKNKALILVGDIVGRGFSSAGDYR